MTIIFQLLERLLFYQNVYFHRIILIIHSQYYIDIIFLCLNYYRNIYF